MSASGKTPPSEEELYLEGKLRRERRMTVISVASLIVFVLALLCAGVFMMARVGLMPLPSFLEEWLSRTGRDEIAVLPDDDGRIYAALQNQSPENGEIAVTRDLHPEEVRSLLLSNTPLEEYTVVNRVSVYGGHMKNTVVNKIWRSGSRYRLESYEANDTLLRVIVCDGERIRLTEYSSKSEAVSAYFDAGDAFSLESQAGMPDLAAIYAILGSAEDSGAARLSVSLARRADANVYQITYGYADSDQTEEIYLSLEYGMIVRAASYMGQDQLYLLETTSMTPALTDCDADTVFNIAS